MYSAGSLAPPRLVRSLRDEQALQVVSDSNFISDEDTVCTALSDVFVIVIVNELVLIVDLVV